MAESPVRSSLKIVESDALWKSLANLKSKFPTELGKPFGFPTLTTISTAGSLKCFLDFILKIGGGKLF